ncbi:MAG: hypothetical protein IPM54_42010 [Polyangiaceae bacterium]|nr:hypothetical protein [Polyangiaceae bacterium]
MRTSTTVFDEEGVFPVKEINALEHETALEYDRRFGALQTLRNVQEMMGSTHVRQ